MIAIAATNTLNRGYRRTDQREFAKPDEPRVSDNNLAGAVYLLYGAGYFTGISALIGVITAT